MVHSHRKFTDWQGDFAMNRYDIPELKRMSPIDEIIASDGFRLIFSENDGMLQVEGVEDLMVNIKRQTFSWPSMNTSGDVITWLESRHGWTFKQAVNFLAARSAMTDQEKKRLSILIGPAAEGSESSVEMEKIARPGTVSLTKGQTEAMRLAYDIPTAGGFDMLLDMNLREILELKGSIPNSFLRITGSSEAFEFCSFCFVDFNGWVDEIFLAVEFDENYRFVSSSGAYCSNCVAKFKRWEQALENLANHCRL
jgi:hypothetical protein